MLFVDLSIGLMWLDCEQREIDWQRIEVSFLRRSIWVFSAVWEIIIFSKCGADER